MTEPRLRTFEVHYETLVLHGDKLILTSKELDAAYFQQGLGVGEDSDTFVVFKDCQHKPVFTVRASAVVTIEEIRDRDTALLTPEQYNVPITPEMQARMTACSGATAPVGYTTTFTMGGPSVPHQAKRDE